MESSVHWCGHMLRIEDGYVLIGVLEFVVMGQLKIGRLKNTWKKQVE